MIINLSVQLHEVITLFNYQMIMECFQYILELNQLEYHFILLSLSLIVLLSPKLHMFAHSICEIIASYYSFYLVNILYHLFMITMN